MWVEGISASFIFLSHIASGGFCCLKQFGPRSEPTECQSWSGSKPFGTLIVFLKEFFKKVSSDLFVWLDSLLFSQQFFSYVGTGLSGLPVLIKDCSRTQQSYAGKAQIPNPWVSSQALFHWATALLPKVTFEKKSADDNKSMKKLPCVQRQ